MNRTTKDFFPILFRNNMHRNFHSITAATKKKGSWQITLQTNLHQCSSFQGNMLLSLWSCSFLQDWNIKIITDIRIKKLSRTCVQGGQMFSSVKFSFCFLTLASAADGTKFLVTSIRLWKSAKILVLSTPCIPEFEYIPWLACLKCHCQFANQIEGKFKVHLW